MTIEFNCPSCKQAISASDECAGDGMACPDCGAFLKVPGLRGVAPPAGEKRRGLAVLFALLLGGLGVHKFYLDRPGEGVFYLLFCWTLIPSLVGLVEGISYLSMTDVQFRRAYG